MKTKCPPKARQGNTASGDDGVSKEAFRGLSAFFLDVAKLIFAGVLLASYMDMTIGRGVKVSSGVVAFTLAMILWFVFLKRSKRKE